MNQLTKKIYYATREISKIIETDFELIDQEDWYLLYQSKDDRSYWRLDAWDKYQEQFLIRIDSIENWTGFDYKDLKIDLLRKTRGWSDEKCVWKDCANNALNGLAICEVHAFNEMNIKR